MRRLPEAQAVFGMIYDVSDDSETVNQQIRDVQYSLEMSHNVNLLAMFRNDTQRTFHRVVLAATIQMFLQMSGINSITYYASTIYETCRCKTFARYPCMFFPADRKPQILDTRRPRQTYSLRRLS